MESSTERSPWISAWSDPVAGVNSFTCMMGFADLKDDGDFKLITTDHKSKQLKVFMGTNVLYTSDLEKTPTAMTTVYTSNKKPMLPLIAVSMESSIYYFKEFAPHGKFDLPLISFSDEEKGIWETLP